MNGATDEADLDPGVKEEKTERVTFSDVLRSRGFLYLWLGQIVSQIGDYFAFLAMMVVVSGFSTDAASTTLAVSGMMIADALPRLLFGILAGVFVDRWDRRRTMIASDAVRCILVLAMIPAFMSKNLLAMYALGFAMSSFGTLFNPAKTALIPKLVPKEQLLSANSLSQTSMVLAMLIGPGLAGATLGIAGAGNEWVAFVVDSVSFLVSAAAIFLIAAPKEQPFSTQNHALDPERREGEGSELETVEGPVRRVWREMLVGLKTLVLNRTVLALALIVMVIMLGVGAVNVLWVVYLKLGFGFEGPELAWRLSLLDVAFGGGMIIASVVMGNFLSHLAPKWLITVSLFGVGVALAIFGYLPDYWLLLVASFVLGIFVAPINTGAGTLVQTVVPNSQLGRVGGGISTASETASLISMSLAGVVGAALGIPVVFVISGLLCLGAGVIGWVFLPNRAEDKAEETAPSGENKLVMQTGAVVDPQLPLVEVENTR